MTYETKGRHKSRRSHYRTTGKRRGLRPGAERRPKDQGESLEPARDRLGRPLLPPEYD